MCNLKPAKLVNNQLIDQCLLTIIRMRGVVSQAMVMCASSPEKCELLDPPVGVVPGDRVTVEGYTGTVNT